MYRLTSFLLFKLPKPILFYLGDFLGILWFDIFRIRRQIVISQLQTCFPDWSREKCVQVGRSSLCNMGRSFMEFLCMPHYTKEWSEKNLIFTGFEKLKSENKKGFLLMSLHLGNGDLACAMLNYRGIKPSLISKKFKMKWLNDFWFGVRMQMGTQFIEPHGPNSSFDILRALRNQNAVIFVLDQYMGRPFGVATKFFGIETGTAYGLALFSMKSGLPVYPIYTYRHSDGRNEIILDEAIPFTDFGHKDESIQRMTQIYNDKLEQIVKKYPEQWMWVHRRWKKF